MSRYQRTSESTINVRTLLFYINMNTYIRINGKRPRVSIIHFYILLRLHTQRNFYASLSVRLSNSGYPVNCSRKGFTDNPCHNLHNYVSSRSTHHNTFLHTHIIQHTKPFVAPDCQMCQKVHTIQTCNILHYYTQSDLDFITKL